MTRKFVCVWVTPYEIEWPIYAGMKRVEYNIGKAHDREEYQNKSILHPEITANIRSCLCEFSSSKHFNQSWNGPYWRHQYHERAKVIPDFGNDGSSRATRRYPDGRLSVLENDYKNNFLLVQGFIPDAVLFPIVERAAAGLPPLDEDIPVWLLGQIRGPAAWHAGYFMKGSTTKKWCNANYLEPVHGVNNYDPEPPAQGHTAEQREADKKLLAEHIQVLADLNVDSCLAPAVFDTPVTEEPDYVT